MKRLYSLLLILLSTLLPALAQNTKTLAERDTISREVTVVSDKVRQIDDTNPIFTPIPLTKPQIERYNPATPRSTRDFTPTLSPAPTPQLSGFAREVPQPYNGIMARLFGGYAPAFGGDLAGQWHFGSQHNVLSLDLTHRSELFSLSKNGPNRSVHGPMDQSDPDYHYLEEVPRQTEMYRHATEGVLGYSYHWRESMIKLQGGIRSHIFAHTPTQQRMQMNEIPLLDRTGWQDALREYSLTGRIDNLQTQNWSFDLGARYAFLSHSLPSPAQRDLIANEHLHVIDADGATAVQLSDDWSLGLGADMRIRTGQPSQLFLLGAHPQFRYRGFVNFADLDFSGGVGVDLANQEVLVYPEVRLSLSDQRRWEWYLQASGGLQDVNPFDYLARIPGIMLDALPRPERQQLASRTGVKLQLGSGTYELYGGYDHYARTYGFNLLPYYTGEELYGSWLQSQRNEYTKLDIFYAGLDLSTVIAKVCELSLGAQFNRLANYSFRVPKPYFQGYAKLAVRPTKRLDLRGVVYYDTSLTTKILHPAQAPKTGLREGAARGSLTRLTAEVTAQYRLTKMWTLFATFDSQHYGLGAYDMSQPYSGRIGVQFNWSAL